MTKSKVEFLAAAGDFEVWDSKYTYTTWIARTDLYNVKTGESYKAGDLCFALISYKDLDGKYYYVNEVQYFIER